MTREELEPTAWVPICPCPSPDTALQALCTAKEIETLRLYEEDLGCYRIGLLVGVSPPTIRNRIMNGQRKIACARRASA